MHRIAVLALTGVRPLELGICHQIFRAVRDDDDRPLYDVMTCSVNGHPVRTSADFTIATGGGTEALQGADTVIIPPAALIEQVVADGLLPAGLSPVLDLIPARARIVSLCLGAFALAAYGVLDGLPATTHWRHTARLQALFPAVTVRPDALFVDAGRVLTSGGATAALDLCLHLVRRDYGDPVARRASRSSVFPLSREGDQALYRPRPLDDEADLTGPTRRWALGNLHEDLQLSDLAIHAGMSVRSFSRRFRMETGVSAMQWLGRQRMARARELLETSDLGVDAVARQSGFGTTVALRQQLRLATGVAPLAYRRAYGRSSLLVPDADPLVQPAQ